MDTPRQHGKAWPTDLTWGYVNGERRLMEVANMDDLTEIYGQVNLGAEMPELPLLPLLPEDEPEDGSDG